MKRPAFQSLRLARKQFAEELSLARKQLAEERPPLSNVRKPFKWHDRLTLIVSACASIAAMVGVGVGYLQVQQMNLARNDAIEVAKKAGLAAQEAGKLDIKRTNAETDQALALAEQVKAITTQVEVSRNQASSSEAQAQSMQSLALASRNQANSTQALVGSSREQYELQNYAFFEARRSKIEIDFVNSDMTSGQEVAYDLSLPIRLFVSQRNNGLNKAAVFTDIHFQMVEGDFNLETIFCPTLRCNGRTPIEISGNSSKVYSEFYSFSSKSLYQDEKDWRLVVVAATNYQDLIQNRADRERSCIFYSFKSKYWNVCGI